MARGKPNPLMLAVLGVAVAAFLTDRLLAPASAADGADAATTALGSTTDPAISEAPAKPGPTLSDRFTAFAERQPLGSDDIASAFAPLGSDREPESVELHQADGKSETSLKLSAVLTRDDGDIAVINGRPMRVGQKIGTIEVLSIDTREVLVQTAVGPITLTLDGPSLQSR